MNRQPEAYPSGVADVIRQLNERIGAAEDVGFLSKEAHAAALAIVAEHRMRAGTSAYAHSPGAVATNTLVAVLDHMVTRAADAD